MNKTLTSIALGILTMSAATAFAQGPGYGRGPGYGPCGGGFNCPWAQGGAPAAAPVAPSADPVKAKLDRMSLRLNLSPEQQAQLEPILRERQAMRAAQQQAMRDKMARILTPEQLAQFDQMRAQGGMGPGGGGRCGGGRGFGAGPGYGFGPGTGYGGRPAAPAQDLLNDIP